MESYSFISEVIDRDDESDEIKNDLMSCQKNKVRFVYAQSAVGKSSLSKKVIEKYNSIDRFTIVVKTPPENTTLNVSEWFYIDRIFECINQYFCQSFKYKKYSFDYYIKNTKDKALKKLIYENILEQLTNSRSKIDVFSVFLSYSIKKLLQIGEFDSNKMTDCNSYNSRMIKIRYILFILKKLDVFLILDNIQNIDDVSWKYLVSWLTLTKNRRHYFLLEYTLSNTSTFEHLVKLMEQIRDTGADVEYSKLNKLPDEYVIDIIDKQFPNKPQDLSFNINLINLYKSDSAGNIRKLIDYTINYSPKTIFSESPTLENLLSLSIISKYILAILINCSGELNIEVFQTLIQLMNISKVDNEVALSELLDRQIIEVYPDKIIICHSSLSDEWMNNVSFFDEYDKLAYINLNKYFSNILYHSDDKNDREYAWLFLLKLYSRKDPVKIEELLLAINDGALEQVSPENTWSYLYKLIENTKDKIFMLQNMYFSILKICFEMELYSQGYQCIKLIENTLNIENCNKLILYKCMFLSALDKHKENIELYNQYIFKVKKYSRIYFNLKLIVLCSYRSLNEYDKCIEIHKDLIKQKRFMHRYEYCIFLRLTNIYLSDDKAVLYAKKSVKEFKKLGNNVQEAKSLITYAKLLAGLGRYEKAKKLIKKAEGLMGNKYIGRHMIYTNYAAFLLMNHHTSEEIWMLLDQSECTAVVPYDKLAIIVNKLVWCYENKQYDALDNLINRANKLIPLEPDEHIHVLIYYNLYLIFKEIGEVDKSTKYFNLAYKNRDKCKFVKARFENRYSREMYHRLRHLWHICFLSYWTYDLDDFEALEP